jgi:5-methyltetrahydropteroyltriglutamate--homocysteine methyltransferase
VLWALDETDYVKADPEVYQRLATAIDDSLIDAVSIEDAHQYNDHSLLEKFANTTVIFGAVETTSIRIEYVDEIMGRLGAALDHIDANRLMATPDCGLIMLGSDLTCAKLSNLVLAAPQI